jgi:hypothetical protein
VKPTSSFSAVPAKHRKSFIEGLVSLASQLEAEEPPAEGAPRSRQEEVAQPGWPRPRRQPGQRAVMRR